MILGSILSVLALLFLLATIYNAKEAMNVEPTDAH
jgi:hypothetical protein